MVWALHEMEIHFMKEETEENEIKWFVLRIQS